MGPRVIQSAVLFFYAAVVGCDTETHQDMPHVNIYHVPARARHLAHAALIASDESSLAIPMHKPH
jgi:hypothetical protein